MSKEEPYVEQILHEDYDDYKYRVMKAKGYSEAQIIYELYDKPLGGHKNRFLEDEPSEKKKKGCKCKKEVEFKACCLKAELEKNKTTPEQEKQQLKEENKKLRTETRTKIENKPYMSSKDFRFVIFNAIEDALQLVPQLKKCGSYNYTPSHINNTTDKLIVRLEEDLNNLYKRTGDESRLSRRWIKYCGEFFLSISTAFKEHDKTPEKITKQINELLNIFNEDNWQFYDHEVESLTFNKKEDIENVLNFIDKTCELFYFLNGNKGQGPIKGGYNNNIIEVNNFVNSDKIIISTIERLIDCIKIELFNKEECFMFSCDFKSDSNITIMDEFMVQLKKEMNI